MRQQYTMSEFVGLVGAGWMIAWFAVEDEDPNTLSVDLCAHWRLNDGKVLFISVDISDCANKVDFIKEVADKAANGWEIEIRSMQHDAQESVGA